MSTLCQIFLMTASDKPKIGWVHRWHKLKFWDQNETSSVITHKNLCISQDIIAPPDSHLDSYVPSICLWTKHISIYNSFWSAKVGKQRIAIHFEPCQIKWKQIEEVDEITTKMYYFLGMKFSRIISYAAIYTRQEAPIWIKEE